MNRKIVAAILVLIAIGAIAYVLSQRVSTASSQGLTAVWIIEYTDGTKQTFHTPALTMTPIVIYDPNQGKVVSSVRLELYATVSYTGQALNWSISGTAKWAIQTTGGTDLYSTTMPLSNSGTSAPPNGQAFVVASSTTTASQIEQLYTGWTSGASYRLYARVTSFTFTIGFIDGKKSASPSSLPESWWTFTYYPAGQISSVSLSWNWVPYY